MSSRNLLILVVVVTLQHLVLAQNPVGYVCLDPGHGGPTAGKYESNGGGWNDSAGAVGQGGLTEEWVNLKVALKAKDIIDIWPITGYWRTPILTRDTDTSDVSIPRRAEIANTYFGGSPVEELLIIHHNGLARPDTQGVETFWYNADTAIGVWPNTRNSTWKLAYKTYWMILDEFWQDRYKPRGTKLNNYWLLALTRSASVYSEASSISFDATEEALFADETYPYHVEQEAMALYRGLKSFLENAGIVYIDKKSLLGTIGDDPRILVDDVLEYVPYQTAWDAGSSHWIEAPWQTNWGGTPCYFHHWEEKETGITNVARLSNWIIPEESTHTYIAYYTGGPYFVDLIAPIGGEYWTMGDTVWIILDPVSSDDGIDNSALIDVWLDRNGGSGGYPNRIVQDYPLSQGIGIPIVPALPGSNNCKIKVWSRDLAENQAYTYSEQSFYVYLIGDVNQSDNITLGDVVYLINYVFDKPQGSCQTSDPDPCWPITPLFRGDANGDCNVTLADITYLANYYFGRGPHPVRCPSLPSAKTLAVSK